MLCFVHTKLPWRPIQLLLTPSLSTLSALGTVKIYNPISLLRWSGSTLCLRLVSFRDFQGSCWLHNLVSFAITILDIRILAYKEFKLALAPSQVRLVRIGTGIHPYTLHAVAVPAVCFGRPHPILPAFGYG